jgi:hypothetical protein
MYQHYSLLLIAVWWKVEEFKGEKGVKGGVANAVSKRNVCPHFLSEQVCSLIIIQICQKTPCFWVFGLKKISASVERWWKGIKHQNIQVFGPLSSQAAIKDSSFRTHGGLKSHVNLHYRSQMQKQRKENLQKHLVCLGVNLLGSTPLTKGSQNAFRSKDKHRTEGVCRKKPHHKLPNPKRKSRLPKLGSNIKELDISCEEYKHSEEKKNPN